RNDEQHERTLRPGRERNAAQPSAALQRPESRPLGQFGPPTNAPATGCDTAPEGGTAMTEMATKTAHRPAWVDLSSTDTDGSREFYSKLFGWQVDVNPDPQYGGYGRATIDGQDAAGITPT